METKKTKTVISKEAKLRAKNYMRLKEGYVEPKQEPCDNCNNDVCCCIIRKQETLEETLKNELEFVHNSCRNFDFDLGFKTGGLIGAKWQQEQDLSMVQGYLSANLKNIELLKRSYSEEEAGELVYNVIGEYAKDYGIMIDGTKLNELFEQLKKK